MPINRYKLHSCLGNKYNGQNHFILLKRHFSWVCRKNGKATQKAGVRYLHVNSSDADGSLSHGWNARNQLANLLTGLGVDEIFSRTDASGARHLLSDALGSTLALTDGTGAVQTSYSYEPYGKMRGLQQNPGGSSEWR